MSRAQAIRLNCIRIIMSIWVSLGVPAHGAETTLTVYFQWGNVIDTLNRAVALFEKENPDIKVVTVPACIDCGTGYEQLPVAIAGGAPPDLVTLTGTYYVEMAEGGLIEPLTEYLGHVPSSGVNSVPAS